MGLVFLLRNPFPDVFWRPTKAKKAAIAKNLSGFLGRMKSYTTKKGDQTINHEIFGILAKNQPGFVFGISAFFFVAHGEPAGTGACRSCRWCICIDSSPKRVIEIRGELPGKTRNLAWRNGRFYSKPQIFGLMIYQGGGTHRNIMKKYHFSKKCNMKKCVYCFLIIKPYTTWLDLVFWKLFADFPVRCCPRIPSSPFRWLKRSPNTWFGKPYFFCRLVSHPRMQTDEQFINSKGLFPSTSVLGGTVVSNRFLKCSPRKPCGKMLVYLLTNRHGWPKRSSTYIFR